MSRIGIKPVTLPSGIEAKIEGQVVTIKGAKGELQETLPPEATAEVTDGAVTVKPANDSQRAKAMWGLSRSLIANMVEGIVNGYIIKLELNGVGYRAAVQGKNLEMALGFSHPVVMPIPAGITVVCPKPTEIEISGINKQLLGEFAANVRKWRKPEPYKGKGIRYASRFGDKGETVRRKEGKKK